MHRRRAALRALCGGFLAARGTAGRKAGRCAGCDTRYLGAYLRFGRVAWQCGCDMRGSHLRSGGLSRRMWRLRDLRRVALRQAVASAPAARQSAARNGVGMAEWPIRHALCSGLIDAQAGYHAACGGYTICGAFVLSQSVAPAQAARQSAARTGVGRVEWPTRRALYPVALRSGGLSRRL